MFYLYYVLVARVRTGFGPVSKGVVSFLAQRFKDSIWNRTHGQRVCFGQRFDWVDFIACNCTCNWKVRFSTSTTCSHFCRLSPMRQFNDQPQENDASIWKRYCIRHRWECTVSRVQLLICRKLECLSQMKVSVFLLHRPCLCAEVHCNTDMLAKLAPYYEKRIEHTANGKEVTGKHSNLCWHRSLQLEMWLQVIAVFLTFGTSFFVFLANLQAGISIKCCNSFWVR